MIFISHTTNIAHDTHQVKCNRSLIFKIIPPSGRKTEADFLASKGQVKRKIEKATLNTNKREMRKEYFQSTNNFLVLLDNLLHHLLDNSLALLLGLGTCVLGKLGLVCVLGELVGFPLLCQELLLPTEPGSPFVEDTLAGLDDGGVGNVDGVLVLLFEFLRVLPEVLADLLLFFLGEEGCGARTPDELLELVGGMLGEGGTGEGVDAPSVFHLHVC